MPNPLALYIFSGDAAYQRTVLDAVPSGSAFVNDVVIHIGNAYLPFGGVRTSAYHPETLREQSLVPWHARGRVPFSFEEVSGDPPVLGREGGFVMGLVVNKRSGVTLADAATEHGMAALDNELLASELFVGGDVSSRTLTGVSDVADDSVSGPPKWFTDDVTSMESGNSRIFCGYCGWSVAQLQNELDRGVWFRAQAPHTVALEPVADDSGTDVWRSALSACGFPELADLAVSHKAVLEAFSAVDGPAASSE